MTEATHWRAALLEIGRPDLADIAFHNRGDYPSIDWCRFDRKRDPYGELFGTGFPTIIDVMMVAQAMRLWYVTFRPDRLHALGLDRTDRNYWQELVLHTERVQALYRKHRRGECECPPKNYGRNPELRQN